MRSQEVSVLEEYNQTGNREQWLLSRGVICM